MKTNIHYLLLSFLIVTLLLSCSNANNTKAEKKPTLKEALNGKFLIGTALNLAQVYNRDSSSVNIIKTQFNSIVAENCMKSMYLQPREGEFFFGDADKFVEFGEKNNMFIIGHTLIWHSQAPAWFFVDEKGKDVSREVLVQRMKNHITTVVSRYKGRIKGWDVVNEAILENGTYRKSKFYEIIGEDFIPLAFQFANEADPDAELYYNDYNEWYKGKRETLVNLVKSFKEKGIRIDAIGMQGHIGMDIPTLEEYESTIEDYHRAGVKVMITELDLSALPSPWGTSANISDTVDYQKQMNPYTDGLPQEIEAEWENRYLDFFRLFLKNQNKIGRVTLWGVSDRDSWRNNFPVKGRTDYPLLFDRKYQAKPIVEKIIQISVGN
ncbi:MAG: endo-1,4-beta-xylanase [Bacteroidales bacterium]|jgi:endo-1,4-beta-xylanase|nr:endo-1,4-beta-xylanase [Bacteroidales bacterium]